MTNIFYGFIFIFLDFTIKIGPISLGLIPNFIGYILIMLGLNKLSVGSKYFAKAKPWAIAMAIYTAVEYVMNIFGITSLIEAFSMVAGIACYVIDIYILAMIINGLQEIERLHHADYEVEGLKNIWLVDILIEGVALALAWLAFLFATLNPVGLLTSFSMFMEIPLLIASVVVSIIFLVKVNNTRKLMELNKR